MNNNTQIIDSRWRFVATAEGDRLRPQRPRDFLLTHRASLPILQRRLQGLITEESSERNQRSKCSVELFSDALHSFSESTGSEPGSFCTRAKQRSAQAGSVRRVRRSTDRLSRKLPGSQPIFSASAFSSPVLFGHSRQTMRGKAITVAIVSSRKLVGRSASKVRSSKPTSALDSVSSPRMADEFDAQFPPLQIVRQFPDGTTTVVEIADPRASLARQWHHDKRLPAAQVLAPMEFKPTEALYQVFAIDKEGRSTPDGAPMPLNAAAICCGFHCRRGGTATVQRVISLTVESRRVEPAELLEAKKQLDELDIASESKGSKYYKMTKEDIEKANSEILQRVVGNHRPTIVDQALSERTN